MNGLFHGFQFICAYIDENLVLTKGECTDHLEKLELTLNKTKEKVLKCNIEKSLFRQTKMEYLGFWVTHDGFKITDKNTSNRRYESTDLPKIITSVHRCS